jgi:spermidine synthase
VKQTRERYDLVFVNLPDPSTALLNRYYTREFYEAVRRILAPGGVIAVRLSSAETYFAGLKGGYAASILRTLGDVFPYVVVMPHEWSYFFASTEPGIVTSDPDELAARFRRRGPRTEHFQAAAFHTYFYGGAAAQFAQQLRERQDVQLNTDLRPISYFYSLLLWDEYSGSKLRPHLERLQRVGLGRAIGALAVLAVLGSGWIVLTPRRAAQHRRASYLLCVAACGFAGMGLEVLLIFAFQNLYGYVYQMIGLLVAVFMFGLAVGGATMNAFLPRLGRSHASLMVVQGLIAAFALALPLTLGGLGAEAASRPHPLIAPALFGLLVGVAGLLTGLELPLASALYLRSSDRISKVAGLVDAADHGGAFVGALTCGALLIPVLGVAATCLLVGALNLSALAVLAATTATGRRGAGGQSGGVY